MLSTRDKLIGVVVIGFTAILLGYALTRAFVGSSPANAIDLNEPQFENLSSLNPESNPLDPAGTPVSLTADQIQPVNVPSPRNRVYTVQPNDSFWKIAKRVYGDVKYVNQLQASNNGIRVLRIGMKIICPPFEGASYRMDLPVLEDAAKAAEHQTVVQSQQTRRSQAQTHVIKNGDSMYIIAEKYYGKGWLWRKIAEANPNINPNRLKPGQEIQIP